MVAYRPQFSSRWTVSDKQTLIVFYTRAQNDVYAAQAGTERLSPMWPTDAASRVDSGCAGYTLSIHLSRKVSELLILEVQEMLIACLLALRKQVWKCSNVNDITVSSVWY